jgi:hypothetical protein
MHRKELFAWVTSLQNKLVVTYIKILIFFRMFLVQRTQISKISLDSPDFTSFPLPFDKVKYAIAIDYDSVEDFIYWSDEDAHVLRRARQDGM